MGAYVERNGKEYYKADNGKLYQDYDAAASANMNPIARVTRFAKEKIKEASNQGAIPIPSINNTGYSALGYVKSLAGAAGRPFAIQSNPETDRFLQQTVDASTKTDNTATFNQNIQDRKEYDRLGSDIGNKAFGRYQGQVQPNGDVVVQDDYDTNRSVQWHGDRALTGKDAQGGDIGLAGRGISAISAIHKMFDNAGLTNKRPYGNEVTIGNVNGAQNAPAPGAPPVIPTANAPAPQPAIDNRESSYSVKSGDTLSAIARSKGTTVDALAKLNGIKDVNSIGVGQQLRF